MFNISNAIILEKLLEPLEKEALYRLLKLLVFILNFMMEKDILKKKLLEI